MGESSGTGICVAIKSLSYGYAQTCVYTVTNMWTLYICQLSMDCVVIQCTKLGFFCHWPMVSGP